ncbi:MAG: antibiotic biosynthesis monooxygenase [Bacteroidales bacterium]|jgi:quinol monooxygenase YgiN|nr:antibiotic biosynthesis monooxygenase [Bacteroidales bacterium]
MENLKIVATIVIKEEFQDFLLEEFKKIVDGTRNETGNISYVLHQDINNPLKYVILEDWESSKAIREHNNTQHYINFKTAIEGKIDNIYTSIIKEVY